MDTLYLEANAEYLTQAAEQETLADLSAQSIERDVCVVTDESVKKALQAEEVYLNGFTFLQAADYETDTVMALTRRETSTASPTARTQAASSLHHPA